MEYFTFTGTEDELRTKLAKIMHEEDGRTFIRNLKNIAIFLDDDEYVEVKIADKESKPGRMAFLVPKTNYNINLKTLTVVTLALLFDVKFFNGVLISALGLTGFKLQALALLDEAGGEKCVVIEAVRSRKHINADLFFKNKDECVNNHLKCKHNNNGKCNAERRDIVAILESLSEKNVFTKIGNNYKYNF